jgi:UDP:flavonoid glycosyltransferase YjiC (YdhE family)
VLTLGGLSFARLTTRENVKTLSFANHDELFPQCEAIDTHGGLGTVLWVMVHGVPLLLLPLGRDQHINAGRVVELGAGTQLAHDATTEEIRVALGTLTAAPSSREAAVGAAARIAADRPDREAVRVVEATARGQRPVEQR